MIDHFQVATMGLGPGWTTFNAAVLGFGFVVGITVGPVPPGRETFSSGSAWLSKPHEWKKHRRLVTITIKYGADNVWTIEHLVDVTRAEAMVSVVNFVNRANAALQISVGNIRASSSARVAANMYQNVTTPIRVSVSEIKKRIIPIISNLGKGK